jgi:hypothetical protein
VRKHRRFFFVRTFSAASGLTPDRGQRRGSNWVRTVRTQRVAIEDALDDYPSLQTLLDDPQWLAKTYRRAARGVIRMVTLYDDDVAAWAQEQVALLRSGQWALLYIEHIAQEIEDMNISHRHQLAYRMAILMAHLLKWKYQPDRRGASWERTIRGQREKIKILLKKMPSLRPLLEDPAWGDDVWQDAVSTAILQANLADLPKVREWDFEQILSADYFPS